MGLVDWEITGFEAQVLTYLIVVTGVSEIKDTVTHQLNLVRDHKHTVLFFDSVHELHCVREGQLVQWIPSLCALALCLISSWGFFKCSYNDMNM